MKAFGRLKKFDIFHEWFSFAFDSTKYTKGTFSAIGTKIETQTHLNFTMIHTIKYWTFVYKNGYIWIICKVRKTQHQNLGLGHKQGEILKTAKNYINIQGGEGNFKNHQFMW
jgi:hypothetical protein